MSGELSGHELKLWIKQKAPRLCAETMNRVPNMLIDENALLYFLETLAETADKLPELQLSSIQNWALTEIGQDARGAYDWLVVLRVLKDEIGELLENTFSPKNALIASKHLNLPATFNAPKCWSIWLNCAASGNILKRVRTNSSPSPPMN
jgi:hypothetical protein